MKLFLKVFALTLLLLAGFFIQLSNGAAQTPPALEPYSQSSSNAVPLQTAKVNADKNAPPLIQATNLITIPYGFDSPLPILEAGSEIIASGHGACTNGEQVTVAITITQSSSAAIATGENEQTCNGRLQAWRIKATPSPNAFVEDMAEACGIATTRNDGYVTDTFEWCRDVDLIALDQQLYLPLLSSN